MLGFIGLFGVLLVLPLVWSHVDLFASGLFYSPVHGFYLSNNLFLVALHWLAYYGARVLGAAFVGLAIFAFLRRRPVAGIDTKAWIFLLLALLIGPGLVANVGLKDHWGRARPREVIEFGGSASFTPALIPQFQNAHENGSFVAGDGAFGFFLPAFAFVVPFAGSRRLWQGLMGVGALFSFARLAMGAHFLSDIMCASLLMLTTITLLHMMMYGKNATLSRWRYWLSPSGDLELT
jgi:lipid A 4'-phosphatase